MKERHPAAAGLPSVFRFTITVLSISLATAFTPAWAQSASAPARPDAPNAPRTGAAKLPAPAEVNQPASRRSNADGSLDDMMVLSPFEVRGEEDSGYQATSTLAGTRLRSNLKDLAASISVVTKDFMDDVNATNLSSLLIYTMNTEVAGPYGNFSGLSSPEAGGNFNDSIGQARPATRVRGLIDADVTRDFFQTDVPPDSYNIERVDISRGANSILFGLGSPAGIVNSTLIKANTRRTQGKVAFAVDNFGSARGTLDYNQVLLADKLAFRLATVYNESKFREEESYDKTRAFTLTATYRPFKNTTIRLTSEAGKEDSSRPQMRPPNDQYSWWWAAGMPVWNPVTNTGHLIGTPQAPFTTSTVFKPDGTRQSSNFLTANFGNWRSNQPGLIYQDPNSAVLGGVDVGGGVKVDGIEGFADRAYLQGGTLVNGGIVGLQAWSIVTQAVYRAGDPLASLYSRQPQITDPNVFDFYNHNLTGPTKYEWGRWTTNNATIEQTFLDGKAGLEATFDKQSMDNGYVSSFDYLVGIDPNEVLPNGAPNPNFLRPLSAGGGFKRIYSEDRESFRVSGFYTADFSTLKTPWLAKFLGHHVLQANYSKQDHYHEKLGGTIANSDLDYRAAEGATSAGDVASTNRLLAVVHYLGASVAGTTSASQARIQGVTALQDPSGLQQMTLLYNPRPLTTLPADLAPWKVQTFGLITSGHEDLEDSVRPASAGYADRTRDKVTSKAGVLQSFWFDGNLVSTVGWRRDEVSNYDAGLSPRTILGTADLNPAVFYPKLVRSIAQESTSWGVVGHTPQFIQKFLPEGTNVSLFYNSASNFRVAPQRYTITGETLPSETGDTKEYGFRLSAFKGRLDLKVAHYETIADKATVTGLAGAIGQIELFVPTVVDRNFLGDNQSNPAGIAAFQAWLDTPNGHIYRNAFSAELIPNTDPSKPVATYGAYADATGDRGQISAASGLKSTGYEFELAFNPTRNLTIAANAASAVAVRTNIAPELYDFVFGTGGLVGLVQNADGTPTAAGKLIGTSSGSTSLQSFITTSILNNGVITTFAQEGTKTDELRKWSYRVITRYSFDENTFGGRLKGLNVGGVVRWADRPLLGYGGTILKVSGFSVVSSDVNQPIFGPTDTTFDLWCSYQHRLSRKLDWKVQLNVQNVGVGRKLLPLYANPDGSTVVWRVKDPQRITLTNTFSF